MQTPEGASLIEGKYYTGNWVHIIFNPSMAWYAGQLVLLAALTAAFLMLGVVAGQSLRRPLDESERKVFKTALALAMAGVVLQAGVGLGLTNNLSPFQPDRCNADTGQIVAACLGLVVRP